MLGQRGVGQGWRCGRHAVAIWRDDNHKREVAKQGSRLGLHGVGQGNKLVARGGIVKATVVEDEL